MQNIMILFSTRYAPGSKGEKRVFFFKVKFERHHLVKICHCPTATNLLEETCRSLCTLIGNSMRVKVIAVLLDTKANLLHSLNLHEFWWVYKVYVAGRFLYFF